MGSSRQEYWSGLPCPPPGDLPDPGVELAYVIVLSSMEKACVSSALINGLEYEVVWLGVGVYDINHGTNHSSNFTLLGLVFQMVLGWLFGWVDFRAGSLFNDLFAKMAEAGKDSALEEIIMSLVELFIRTIAFAGAYAFFEAGLMANRFGAPGWLVDIINGIGGILLSVSTNGFNGQGLINGIDEVINEAPGVGYDFAESIDG